MKKKKTCSGRSRRTKKKKLACVHKRYPNVKGTNEVNLQRYQKQIKIKKCKYTVVITLNHYTQLRISRSPFDLHCCPFSFRLMPLPIITPNLLMYSYVRVLCQFATSNNNSHIYKSPPPAFACGRNKNILCLMMNENGRHTEFFGLSCIVHALHTHLSYNIHPFCSFSITQKLRYLEPM